MNTVAKIVVFFLSVSLCTLFFAVWLFLGIIEDDEFPDYYLFLKHRPDWQFYFDPVLPSGYEQSDIDRLSDEEKEIHYKYHEFYKNRKNISLL